MLFLARVSFPKFFCDFISEDFIFVQRYNFFYRFLYLFFKRFCVCFCQWHSVVFFRIFVCCLKFFFLPMFFLRQEFFVFCFFFCVELCVFFASGFVCLLAFGFVFFYTWFCVLVFLQVVVSFCWLCFFQVFFSMFVFFKEVLFFQWDLLNKVFFPKCMIFSVQRVFFSMVVVLEHMRYIPWLTTPDWCN